MAAQTFSENKTSLDDQIVTGMTPLNMMHAKATSENNTQYDELVDLVWASCEKGIPGDLLVQILLKLPVKSLLRFKAVCKPWKLLIDSHIFINNHLHTKNPLHNLFPVKCLEPSREDDNPFPFDIEHSVGSCNGIICFKTTNPQNPLVLYNPSTREFSFLPKECRGDFYGFCYLSQTQEYKVICFEYRNWNPEKDRPCKVDMRILTLGTNTTSSRDVKGVTLPGYINFNAIYPTQASYGGTIVFTGDDFESKDIAICYDVLEDRFSKMDLPPSFVVPEDDITAYSLAVFQNSVIMFLHRFVKDVTSFDIWILVNENESNVKSWTKYRHVEALEICPIISPINACRGDRWILCSKGDNGFGEEDNLFYYDLETNQIEDYKTENPGIVVKEFVNYVESLVSPKNICSSLMY